MDPASNSGDIEPTRFCPQTDGPTDGQTNKVKLVYPPLNFVEAGYKFMSALYFHIP